MLAGMLVPVLTHLACYVAGMWMVVAVWAFWPRSIDDRATKEGRRQ